MAEIGQDRRSLLENCRLSAPSFLLRDANARTIINEHAGAIIANWGEVCDEAGLAEVDRAFLWRPQILNDYVFEGYADGTPAGF
jgi:serine/threonine-protein kinase HipA